MTACGSILSGRQYWIAVDDEMAHRLNPMPARIATMA
jgi:hypothetical protein